MRHVLLRESHNGDFLVWEEPEPDAHYVLGADIALSRSKWVGDDKEKRRRTAGDDSALVVMKRSHFGTLEQVAGGRVQMESGAFGDVMAAMGARYNHAVLNIERNLADAAFYSLQRAGYPLDRLYQPPQHLTVTGNAQQIYFMPKTGGNSKFLVDTMLDYLRNGQLKIRDENIIAELRSLQRDENGKVNTRGKDLSVALMMAVIVDATTEPVPPPLAEKMKKDPPFGVDPEAWRSANNIKPEVAVDVDDAPDWGAGDGMPEWEEIP